MTIRGFIIAALTLNLVAAPSALAEPDGSTVFQQRCAACHSIAASPEKLGPPLKGVIGRRAGASEGYRYSPGMKKVDFAWSPARIDNFLANPTSTVSGTKMTTGLLDPIARRAVIHYLATQK